MSEGASKRMNLSVGIVTYNSERVIEQALRSLLDAWPRELDGEVIVYDNCSSDGTVKLVNALAETLPRIRLLTGDSNLGFGGGHNRIMGERVGDVHIFCNPDIVVKQGALTTLCAFLADHPDIGIVCPQVHFGDGRLQALNRRYPNVLDLFLRRFLPQTLHGLFEKRLASYEMRDVGYDHMYDVPFVSGAFMACRTAAIQQAGGFDERYFLYFEDADLSRAVQQLGWRTTYCPDALVIHGWQREAHKNNKAAAIFVQSAFRYFGKWGWKLI
jgi:hypothetical protein|tara:strand:+ start:23747 stop:24559 length:813 start_codon:yes stop_codon:yes gene_type:complete